MDTKQHWERIYAERSPTEVSWFQGRPETSLALIEGCGLDRDAPIIDVGGGASRLVDELLAADYRHVAVLDIAARSLDHARQRLGARAAQVAWYAADVTQFEPPEPVALWHDRAVFHFLREAEARQRYVARVRRTVRPGGHVIIAAFAIGGPTHCSGLEIVQYDAERLMVEMGEGFALEETVAEDHLTPGGATQAFNYFHLRRL